jgi:hypothetical protein
MSFWKTFVRVWQVRTSIRIQEGIEGAIEEAKHKQQLEDNLPQILHELHEKNSLWDREMEFQRSQIKKK